MKRIVFCLKHLKNVTIRGEESLLIFHTEEIPFYLYQCENISIEGICIDCERPTFSEGIIQYVDEHRIRLYIDKEKYPWHIAHQRMFFTGENFCCELQFWLEMDKDTYAPVYGTSDIGFAEDMSHLRENMALENISRIPEILIENCIFRNNRARGLLLTTRGKTVVRKNLFQVPGSAIFVSGDCCDWFESGATEDILVEENIFDNCSYFPIWGKAPIQVEPSTRQTVKGEYYHQLLKVSRNIFYCFDERIISAYNLKNLEFTENEIIRTRKYPAREGEAFSLCHVGDFREDKNSFKTFEEAE